MLQRMLVYVFSDGISRAMPFLVLPIIANYLTVEDFGLVTNFTVLVELFAAFVSLSSALSLAVDYFKVDRRTLLSNLLVMITGLFLFAFLVILIFNHYFFLYLKLSLKWQVYALVTAWFNSVFQIYYTKLRYDEKAKLFGVLQFLRAFLSAGLSVLMVVVLDWSWEGRAASLIITGLILSATSFILLRKEKMIFVNVNWAAIYGAILFGLPMLPQAIFQWLRGGFEKALITKEVGLGGNGLMSFAGTIASIFMLFSGAFFSTYTPILFKSLTQAEKEEQQAPAIYRDILKKAYLFLGFLLFLIIAGNFLTGFLIHQFFRNDYQGAINFMPFALLGVYFSALSSWLASFLQFKKKSKLIGVITISQTCIQLLLTYVMVIHFGTIGAFYANIAGALLWCTILFYFVNREYRLPWLTIGAK